MSESNVITLDSLRSVEDIVKRDLHCDEVVICGTMSDGSVLSYVSDTISDIELVYIIQTLKDRREMRENGSSI